MTRILTPQEYPDLPKRPEVFINGLQVTVEQAKEINFRTDTNLSYIDEYGFGNDRSFRQRCQDLFGWNQVLKMTQNRERWNVTELWAKQLGYIGTSYIHNSWLASCYIGGANGWCRSDGTILMEGQNVGTWPSVAGVVEDWQNLVKAFPFLDLVCTLFSAEAGEDDGYPVATIIVKDGSVTVVEPDLALHQREPVKPDFDDMFVRVAELCRGDYSYEQGWPEEWVVEFGERSRAAIEAALSTKGE